MLFFFKFLKVIFISLNVCEDVPGGPVLTNLPANAGDMGSICRGHVFNLWSRKNPCIVGQLRLCTTTAEACTPRSSAPGKRSHTGQLEIGLHTELTALSEGTGQSKIYR